MLHTVVDKRWHGLEQLETNKQVGKRIRLVSGDGVEVCRNRFRRVKDVNNQNAVAPFFWPAMWAYPCS